MNKSNKVLTGASRRINSTAGKSHSLWTKEDDEYLWDNRSTYIKYLANNLERSTFAIRMRLEHFRYSTHKLAFRHNIKNIEVCRIFEN